MLTNSQLSDLSTKMGIPLEGIYFKDELPSKLKYNQSYIINLEDSVDKDGNENEGTHWTCMQVNKYPDGKIEPLFFDPYGAPPSENIKKFVLTNTNKTLPYTERDIQSLMNNACGWYCLAILHYVNASQYRTNDLYTDVSNFLDLFDDLNVSADWKKNEFILKQFFQSSDPAKRKTIEVIADPNTIMNEDAKGGKDMFKIPVDIKVRN